MLQVTVLNQYFTEAAGLILSNQIKHPYNVLWTFSLICCCPSKEFQFSQLFYIVFQVNKSSDAIPLTRIAATKCLAGLQRPNQYNSADTSMPYMSTRGSVFLSLQLSSFKNAVFLLPPFSLSCYKLMITFLPICIFGDTQ